MLEAFQFGLDQFELAGSTRALVRFLGTISQGDTNYTRQRKMLDSVTKICKF